MLDFGFYNMDCNVAMQEFPDDYFDLAVVDPPYGINTFHHGNESRTKLATAKKYKIYAGGDKAAPDPEYFAQLKRISKNQIIFGANHFMDNIVEGFRGGVPAFRRRVGLYGTSRTDGTTSPTGNLPSRHLIQPFGYSGSHGRVCVRET